jgi:pimeloyl-ACP methyl ester carboxylesterase
MTKLVLPALAAALLLCVASARAEPPAGQNALAAAKIRVDVGGRKLNLYRVGQGAPTVVFEADAGRASWDWSAVLPEVARRTRACVLVGAGFGAMIAQQFALRSRGAVTGLVLVDALHEDAMPADRAAALAAAEACLAAAEQGKTGAGCAYPASAINGEVGPVLAAAQAAQVASPIYWRARASELDSMAVSATQMRTARKPFGELPVVEVKQATPTTIVAAVLQVLDQQAK